MLVSLISEECMKLKRSKIFSRYCPLMSKLEAISSLTKLAVSQ